MGKTNSRNGGKMAPRFVTKRDGSDLGDHLLPPGHNTIQLDHTEAPIDNDGSFLVTETTESKLRRMPVDPVTGLPYAIIPVELPVRRERDTDTNYHHHFYFRTDPNLEGSLRLNAEALSHPENIRLSKIAGLAVRMSRGQLLQVNVHDATHARFGLGPILPQTIDEKFVVAVKACAGVVSRYGLDLTREVGDELVYMDNDLFNKIANPRSLCTEKYYYDRPADYRRRVLGSFFLRYAARQDYSQVSRKLVGNFLSATDRAKQLEFGSFILKQGLEMSIAPLEAAYSNLKEQGMVQPRKPALLTTVRKHIHPERVHLAFNVLRDQLKTVA